MRIHVLAVPHAQTTKEFTGCAFTQKVWKFLKMMSGRGHEIIHYGHATTDWAYPDVEHVPVIDDVTVESAYGPEYTQDKRWKQLGFAHYYDTKDQVYATFQANIIKELTKRQQPDDLVLHFFGWGTKPVADALPDMIHIEPGIGYSSTWARWRVFESHTVLNALAGQDAVQHCKRDWYSRVIPNYFDLADFTYSQHKDNYMLYLGRIGTHKGVDIAVEVARHTGRELVIAGQGRLADMGIKDIPSNVVEFGYADAEQRRVLMSRASSLFIGSTYLEPFGGVQVESWLSGTPVIAPDSAAFAEYGRTGRTGYLCNTFRDFVEASENAHRIRSLDCRVHGEQFALDRIAPKYERYFQDVLDVYTGKGWYQL